jgi:hypothetical protein
MKNPQKPESRFLLLMALIMSAGTALNVDYYDTHGAENNITVFFIKNPPCKLNSRICMRSIATSIVCAI